MSPQIGKIVDKDPVPQILQRAKLRASLMPDLLSEARQIVANVISGWHGRKKRGIGENFWQFRPYAEGEDYSKIDWRRSARDDQTYVKDLEWEAAHTCWVWCKMSSSMNFQSNLSSVSKISRGLVLSFAAVELLARSGERVGWPSVFPASSSRNCASLLAQALIHSVENKRVQEGHMTAYWPETHDVKKYSQMIIVSDFLDPLDALIKKFDVLFARGVNASLIHVIDPAEQNFPYSGRTEFLDPSNGDKFLTGDAHGVREKYIRQFNARIESLKNHSRRLGWGYHVHYTDKPASSALVALHGSLSGANGSNLKATVKAVT